MINKINNYFNIKQTGMIKKTNTFRACSPIRSPIKGQLRGLSPIRSSPFSRQGPLSPIKARMTLNKSKTPTRIRENQRVQLTKSPLGKTENFDCQQMQRTLKSGVGLFQQLAHQHKIGSQKKQNKFSTYNTFNTNTNPFQYSQRKKQSITNYPNSFTALIHNVKEIQSIQASKGLNNQLSFKTIQKSKNIDSNIKNQRAKNTEPLNIIESFGSLGEQQQQKQTVVQLKANSQKKPQNLVQVSLKYRQSEPDPASVKKQVEQSKKIQLASSFQDVILLIRKASQKVKDESSVTQQQVKKSFEEEHHLSFNMNPFI